MSNPTELQKEVTLAAEPAVAVENAPSEEIKVESPMGHLFVVEGIDGSGRSTQIAMLQEWLESIGFAVQTIGLRRSNLLARNIDKVLAKNVAGRLTLGLMYATDFYDQLENIMIPALRAGYVVLADRYIYTLMARAAVRGIGRTYLEGIYELALRPELTFWLKIDPKTAFEREFKKSQAISYWESGRDLHLSDDLYESFVQYQSMMRDEFQRLSETHEFIPVSGEDPETTINRELRKRIAARLGVKNTRYSPSRTLSGLMR